MSIVVFPNRYCVYTHAIDGVVFFVGKGLGERPFETTHRNSEWIRTVRLWGRFEVSIVAWFDRERDAIRREREMVKALKPVANTAAKISVNANAKANVKAFNKEASRRVPCELNVARLTDYGHRGDWVMFKVALQNHLGVAYDPDWVVPQGWVDAYNKYFVRTK